MIIKCIFPPSLSFQCPTHRSLPLFVFFVALFMCSIPPDVLPSAQKMSRLQHRRRFLWVCGCVPRLVCICSQHVTLMHKLEKVWSAYSVMNITGNILQQQRWLPCLTLSPESIFTSAEKICVVHQQPDSKKSSIGETILILYSILFI